MTYPGGAPSKRKNSVFEELGDAKREKKIKIVWAYMRKLAASQGVLLLNRSLVCQTHDD